MKNWYRQWDDFLNEAEEPKLKSSGNVDSHLDKMASELTPAEKQDIKSGLKNLFQDKEFSGLLAKHKSNPDNLNPEDKEYLANTAEEFIREQGLTTKMDLPGADAAIAFVEKMKDKVGFSTMEEKYSLDGPGPDQNLDPSTMGYSLDDAVMSSTLPGDDVAITP